MRPRGAAGTQVTALETVDRVLGAHAAVIGQDLAGYRNHVYRVVNLCALLAGAGDDEAVVERVAVAAVYHDLGIWTHRTFDYLAPSLAMAMDDLSASGRSAWQAEVAAMILEHHKVRAYRGTAGPLVESFRQADWIDVTGGVRRFGVARAQVRTLYARWPSAGFHARLLRLGVLRLRTHPWSPLPMVRF
jgi:hypothetical protein